MPYPRSGLSWLLSISLAATGATMGTPGQAATGHGPQPEVSQWPMVPLTAGLQLRLGVRPSRYRNGAFRRSNSCIKRDAEDQIAPVEPPLQAEELTSSTPAEAQGAINLAQAAHPTFLAYVPELDGEFEGETQFHGIFMLTEVSEAGEREVYQSRFPLAKQGGLVGVQLPASEAPLETGKAYVWMLAVECSASDPSANPFFESWVQRVEAIAPVPAERDAAVAFYAASGFWQDAVGLLAAARYADPGDAGANQLWRDLMAAAGLNQFATTPMLQLE